MSRKPGIGIAITTYNRRDQLLKLVNSLREYTNPRVPIVVFDDGGSDGSREATRDVPLNQRQPDQSCKHRTDSKSVTGVLAGAVSMG